MFTCTLKDAPSSRFLPDASELPYLLARLAEQVRQYGPESAMQGTDGTPPPFLQNKTSYLGKAQMQVDSAKASPHGPPLYAACRARQVLFRRQHGGSGGTQRVLSSHLCGLQAWRPGHVAMSLFFSSVNSFAISPGRRFTVWMSSFTRDSCAHSYSMSDSGSP